MKFALHCIVDAAELLGLPAPCPDRSVRVCMLALEACARILYWRPADLNRVHIGFQANKKQPKAAPKKRGRAALRDADADTEPESE